MDILFIDLFSFIPAIKVLCTFILANVCVFVCRGGGALPYVTTDAMEG